MSERVAGHVATALRQGWRVEDIVELLSGPARQGNGFPWGVCEECGQMEYVDGLIATEMSNGIVGRFVCPPCRIRERVK